MIERVDDLTTAPVVGRFYLVRCIPNGLASKWLPIMGILHSDPDIAPSAGRHFHYDFRFISTRQMVREFETPAYQIEESLTQFCMLQVGNVDNSDQEKVTLRRRKCVREIQEFPMRFAFQDRVEEICRGAKINTVTQICPHRGVDLRSAPLDKDGCKTCPGHGLKWSMTTGELVSRLPVAFQREPLLREVAEIEAEMSSAACRRARAGRRGSRI